MTICQRMRPWLAVVPRVFVAGSQIDYEPLYIDLRTRLQEISLYTA